jgi:hypothetical protein
VDALKGIWLGLGDRGPRAAVPLERLLGQLSQARVGDAVVLAPPLAGDRLPARVLAINRLSVLPKYRIVGDQKIVGASAHPTRASIQLQRGWSSVQTISMIDSSV